MASEDRINRLLLGTLYVVGPEGSYTPKVHHVPTKTERAALAFASKGTVTSWPNRIGDEEIKECRRQGWLDTWYEVLPTHGGGLRGPTRDDLTDLGAAALRLGRMRPSTAALWVARRPSTPLSTRLKGLLRSGPDEPVTAPEMPVERDLATWVPELHG